jgi:hypothetical protein
MVELPVLYFASLFLSFLSLSGLSSGIRRSISTLNTANDAVCDKEVRFMGLIDEKVFFRGNIPSIKLSKGILHANEKVE